MGGMEKKRRSLVYETLINVRSEGAGGGVCPTALDPMLRFFFPTTMWAFFFLSQKTNGNGASSCRSSLYMCKFCPNLEIKRFMSQVLWWFKVVMRSDRVKEGLDVSLFTCGLKDQQRRITYRINHSGRRSLLVGEWRQRELTDGLHTLFLGSAVRHFPRGLMQYR